MQPEGTTRPINSPFHNLQWLITEPYGEYDNGGTHRGMDLAQYPYNSQDFTIPVYSISNNGRVLATGKDASRGNYVIFRDLDSNYAFTYMHLLDNSIVVSVGDTLTHASKIGIMGSTGNSTALHLHIEARDMSNTDIYSNAPRTSPAPYLGVVNKSYRYYWAVYYWYYDGSDPEPPITPKPYEANKNTFPWFIIDRKNKLKKSIINDTII